MDGFLIFIIVIVCIIAIVAIIALITSVKIINQSTTAIVQRLGRYHRTLEAGPHMIVPFIDRVYKKISLKEQVADFDPQPVITKDNVTMQIS